MARESVAVASERSEGYTRRRRYMREDLGKDLSEHIEERCSARVDVVLLKHLSSEAGSAVCAEMFYKLFISEAQVCIDRCKHGEAVQKLDMIAVEKGVFKRLKPSKYETKEILTRVQPVAEQVPKCGLALMRAEWTKSCPAAAGAVPRGGGEQEAFS